METGGQAKIEGIEATYSWKAKNWNGWLSYDYVLSRRLFDNINNGEWFNFRYANNYNIKMNLTYRLKPKKSWDKSINLNVVWGSGLHYSFPEELQFSTFGSAEPVFLEFNNVQTPNYFRIDLGYSWTRLNRRFKEQSWSVSVYNVLARRNAFESGYSSGRTYVLSRLNFLPGFSVKRDF